MTINELKSKIADLRSELATRQAKFTASQQQKVELTAELQELRADQMLNGGSHANKIASVKNSLSEVEDEITVWPNLIVEVEREIAAANQDLLRAEQEARIDRYHQILAIEGDVALGFVEACAQAVAVANAFHNLLREKRSIVETVQRANNDIGDGRQWISFTGIGSVPHMPHFFVDERDPVTAARDYLNVALGL